MERLRFLGGGQPEQTLNLTFSPSLALSLSCPICKMGCCFFFLNGVYDCLIRVSGGRKEKEVRCGLANLSCCDY